MQSENTGLPSQRASATVQAEVIFLTRDYASFVGLPQNCGSALQTLAAAPAPDHRLSKSHR